jgi:hypothetical protein
VSEVVTPATVTTNGASVASTSTLKSTSTNASVNEGLSRRKPGLIISSIASLASFLLVFVII